MIAEEFEPLIAAGAIARAFERGNMRERAIEQRGVLEAIADALLKRTIAAATAAAHIFWSFDCGAGRALARRPHQWRTAVAEKRPI